MRNLLCVLSVLLLTTDKAVELAKKEETEIICVNVIEDFCPIGLTEIDCSIVRVMQTKESNAITANALAEFKRAGVNARVDIETGSPAELIIEVAKREGAAMIIAASHGKHGAKKFAFGSVTAIGSLNIRLCRFS